MPDKQAMMPALPSIQVNVEINPQRCVRSIYHQVSSKRHIAEVVRAVKAPTMLAHLDMCYLCTLQFTPLICEGLHCLQK